MTFETFFSALFHIQYSVVIWVGVWGIERFIHQAQYCHNHAANQMQIGYF